MIVIELGLITIDCDRARLIAVDCDRARLIAVDCDRARLNVSL